MGEENKESESKEPKAKDNETSQPSNLKQDLKGCFFGCGGIIVIFIILMLMLGSCTSGGGRSYQPGDFDFDGDSGDLNDATEFLKWKINEERRNGD